MHGPMRRSRVAVHHIFGGSMRANGPNVTLIQWAHAKSVPPGSSILCRPTRESRMAVNHIFGGPMRANGPNVICMHGPMR